MKSTFFILTILFHLSTFAETSCLQLFVTDLQNYIPPTEKEAVPQRQAEFSSLSLALALKHYQAKAIGEYKQRKYDEPAALGSSLALFEKHKADFLQLAKAIKDVAAADGKLIVGIGGSPSPLVGLLNLNGVESAFNLPVSVPYLPKNKIDVGAKRLREAHRAFTPEQIQILFNLWKIHFKDMKSMSSKILLVDYADTGTSAEYVRKLLIDFLSLHYSVAARIDILTFQYGPSPFSVPVLLTDRLHRANKSGYFHWSYALPYDLYHAFQAQKFKALSEWPSFVPGFTDSKTIQRRHQNRIFMNFIIERKSTHLIE
jgi:hypothetical protein